MMSNYLRDFERKLSATQKSVSCQLYKKMALKRAFLVDGKRWTIFVVRPFLSCRPQSDYILSTFAANSTSELNVLWHDGNSLGVNGTQVSVFEESDEISLAGFLKSHDGRALETQIRLKILCDFTDETLERQLANQQFSALLVTTDLAESHRSRPVTMWLLHASCGRSALPGCLGCKLLPWSLTTGRFASGLLRTCHDEPSFLSSMKNRIALTV